MEFVYDSFNLNFCIRTCSRYIFHVRNFSSFFLVFKNKTILLNLCNSAVEAEYQPANH